MKLEKLACAKAYKGITLGFKFFLIIKKMSFLHFGEIIPDLDLAQSEGLVFFSSVSFIFRRIFVTSIQDVI